MAVPAGWIDLGAVGYTDKGNYNPTTTYNKLNVVKYKGSSWVCNLDNTIGQEPTEGIYWHTMMEGVVVATTEKTGTVMPDGETILVDKDGKVSVPTATETTFGLVKPDGETITIKDGVLSGQSKVAIATTSTAGLVKPDGTTIKIADDGTISAESTDLTGYATTEALAKKGDTLSYADSTLKLLSGETVLSEVTIEGGAASIQVKVTFDEAFKGAEYSITGGDESYTGTVPDGLVVIQKVKSYNTTYTVKSTANSTEYRAEIATGQFAGEYAGTLSSFKATIAVTYNIDGAKVTDDTIVTVTDGTHTYKTTIKKSGTHTFLVYNAGTYTVSMTNGTDTSPSATVEVKDNDGEYTAKIYYRLFLYGYDDPAVSSIKPQESVTYPEDVDNAAFTPMTMNMDTGVPAYNSWKDSPLFDFFRPVMLKFNGTVDYELDHNDHSKKLDGTPSDVANTSYEGNAMVGVKKLYMKRWTDTDNKRHFRVSDQKIDDDYLCDAHFDSDGKEKDEIYLPMFEGVIINGKMRSLSGQHPSSETTGPQEISACEACGDHWQLDDWSNTELFEDLMKLIYATKAVQESNGYGHLSEGNGAGSLLTTGGTLKAGMFYGRTAANNTYVKAFYTENYYSDRWDRKHGIVTNAAAHVLVKMRPPYDDTGAGSSYHDMGFAIAGTSDGYISATHYDRYGDIPTQVSGSQTTYKPDGCWFAASCFLLWGGDCGSSLLAGFAFSVAGALVYSDWGAGGSPSYK